jgi:hypothetical protein
MVYKLGLLIVGGRKGVKVSRRWRMLFRQRRGGWRVEIAYETSFYQTQSGLLGRSFLQQEGLSKCMIGSGTNSEAPTAKERSAQREAGLLAAFVNAGPDRRESYGQPEGQWTFHENATATISDLSENSACLTWS